MFSEVALNEELTLATFGYKISDLHEGSHSKIVVTCKCCKTNIHRERRNTNGCHKCPTLSGDTKRCYKCKEWKDLSLFNKSRKMSGGVAKICRECYNKQEAVIKCNKSRSRRFKYSIENGDIEFYIKRRIGTIKSRANKNHIEFDLNIDDLLSLWQNQKGLCFYSGIPMKNSMKQDGFQSWDGPSLDRVDPSKGYVKGNVVWCIFGINSFKQSLDLISFEAILKSIDWWYNKPPLCHNGELNGTQQVRKQQKETSGSKKITN